MNARIDTHTQLRQLYRALLNNQENFDEFKQMLSRYPHVDGDVEPAYAAGVRDELNERIRDWLGNFEGLSAKQVLLWRTIVVDERINVALSPWKESNLY
jgi:hypothetical protein